MTAPINFTSAQSGIIARSRAAAWPLAAALVLASLGPGCVVAPGPLSAPAIAPNEGGQQTALLIRVTTEVDGQPAAAFGSTLPVDNLWLGLQDFSTGMKAKPADLRFLSAATRQAGWTYLLLDPGLHYLVAHEPQSTNVFAYTARWSSGPRWFVEIPAGVRLVYGGTLFLPGTGRAMLFGPRQLVSFDQARLEVRDETAAARSLAAQWFPGRLPAAVCFLKRHQPGDPLIIETPAGK